MGLHLELNDFMFLVFILHKNSLLSLRAKPLELEVQHDPRYLK